MTHSDDSELVRFLAESPMMAALYAKLRKSERMMANAQRIAHFGCWEFDMSDPTKLEGNVVRWSDEVYRILGYTPDEVEPSVENYLKRVHPEDLERAREASLLAFRTFTTLSIDHRILHPDGTIRWVHEDAAISKDDLTDRVLYVTGTVRDVTELRLAEMQRAEAVKKLVGRNADLERLGFMVSHDLRGPLTTMMAVTSLLQEADLDARTQQECIVGLQQTVTKIDASIRELSTIFEPRHQLLEEQSFVKFADVVDGLQSALGLQRIDLGLTTDFTAAEGVVALPGHVRNIVQNLVSNCVKYCRTDVPPKLHISSSRTADSVVLSFLDNCLDIDMRTHGLYMVKAQMESMGGTVSVRGNVDVGAEFILTFPTHGVQG